ncbi:MAG TPA: type II toxin-antitoxin system HipA family toxin [Nitratifractor sp.]|nr:type II toxin-antitoxin system HipA family toxin [Nitratifractor sp.]HHH20749.1 type II toxin-antitoxin system HipA family toxin [Nitratifractor sp.]
MVEIYHNSSLVAHFLQDKKQYLIEYQNFNLQNSITLSLPNTKRLYLYEYRFPPFLESFLPEGYLYEIFKNLLSKEYGRVDDYLIFSLLAPSIESRVAFKSDLSEGVEFPLFSVEDVINNDSNDFFNRLVETFLKKNAISGVQPKSVALLQDKEQLQTKEYIVKTWGEEYPDLARNEYFCMQVAKKAGLESANVTLSKRNRFLIVEKFTLKASGEFYGFEEICSLMDKNRDSKYSGSYEQIAKIIYSYTTNKKESLLAFYKSVVINYLVKNGDAHLKNFGLLFDDDFKQIFYSPVYDIVNSVVYIHKDKPALMLNGKKVWWNKETLVKFGQKSCMLSLKEAEVAFQTCVDALKWGIEELKEYTKQNPDFKIGKMMQESWEESLKTHVLNNETTKELADELTRAWADY